MVKAVMFDLDGTLHNRDASIQSFITCQHERLFPHLDKKRYVRRFMELDQGGYVWKDRVYQQIVKEFVITTISWQDLLTDYLYHFPPHAKLYQQSILLLNELKRIGMKLAIISNGNSNLQRAVLQALEIDVVFDEVIISEEVGLKKPDARIFELALTRLGIAREEAIFVGDHLKNDIEGANRVGLHTIWTQNEQSAAAVPGAVVTELLDILPIIERIRARTQA